jgi:UDP-glucose 4-epimerase
MTILVTGAAGYIGSHMVYELLDAGETVVALDNLTRGFRWAVPDGIRSMPSMSATSRAWRKSSPLMR